MPWGLIRCWIPQYCLGTGANLGSHVLQFGIHRQSDSRPLPEHFNDHPARSDQPVLGPTDGRKHSHLRLAPRIRVFFRRGQQIPAKVFRTLPGECRSANRPLFLREDLVEVFRNRQ